MSDGYDENKKYLGDGEMRFGRNAWNAAIESEAQRIREEVGKARSEAYDDAVAAVDQAHARNISGENWHERSVNTIRAFQERAALRAEQGQGKAG
jgi:hypothetical protein